jgi:pimeloyl-ACP methyl ester carboxylesterase
MKQASSALPERKNCVRLQGGLEMKTRYLIATVALLVSGCATAPPPVKMDATVLKVDMSAPRPDFETWKADYIRRLETASRMIETRWGPIEYSDVGEGVPYLSLHGTPGGYDQSLASRNANPQAQAGVRTIAVSRPGYLRTPLSSGATFEQQADLFAALLDELKIKRVVVIASSGGGYPGLQFALRHPDRCIALIMLAPAMGYEPFPDSEKQTPAQLAQLERMMWGANDAMLASFLQGLDPTDPEQKAMAGALAMSSVPAMARNPGRENDRTQRTDRAVDNWPLEKIRVPTLIIHGTKDENSDYNLSVKAAARIPGARLATLEGVNHYFPLTRGPEMRAHMREFLSKIPGATQRN